MSKTIVRADARLHEALRLLHFHLRTTESAIDHADVRDRENRYLFSSHRHKNHLLFYIRDQALKVRSTPH